MIKLTPRLKTIASLVPEGSRAADIGADHGYLSVFLVEQGICPKVIAGEKNEKPLRKAEELVKSMGLEDRVLIRQGDGLEVIKNWDKVNTVIIAGMGGQTLINILRKDYNKLKDIETLILQPMTDIPLVRKWLIENNYKIAREELAREGKQFYEIIVAEPGEEELPDDIILELGPRLLEGKDPLFKAYLLKKLALAKKVIENLKKSKQEISPQKYNYWINLAHKIEEELKCRQEQ